MKIIISINTSWNIYNFRSGLVTFLKKEGHEVIAVAPKDDYSQKLESELGCKFYPIDMDNKGSNPVKDIFLTFSYLKLFKKIKPDVILQYTIKPNIYGSIAARLLSIPTINNVSGLGTIFINPNNITSKVALMLYRFAFKFPKRVFFQNNDDLELFIDFNLVKKEISDVLPGSGVDLEKFKYSKKEKKEKFIFLMISRILYDKGIVEFIDAAREIKSKYKNVEFQILGMHDESKGSIPKVKFKKWQEEGIVNYLGVTDDVVSKIITADCVVLPSYREGTPKTLLESLAVGRPIVTTNAPGCKETVINGENGYLCEIKNSKSLESQLIKIIN